MKENDNKPFKPADSLIDYKAVPELKKGYSTSYKQKGYMLSTWAAISGKSLNFRIF
jgi:hypothetical protein